MMKKIAMMITSVLAALFLLGACTVAPAPTEATEAPASTEATEAPAQNEATEAPATASDSGDLSFSFTTLTGGTLDQSVFLRQQTDHGELLGDLVRALRERDSRPG